MKGHFLTNILGAPSNTMHKWKVQAILTEIKISSTVTSTSFWAVLEMLSPLNNGQIPRTTSHLTLH
ncbi:hypothetical protein LIA77_11573 [Sarocladium implicatum]|nr:hypothetical protein LIA77_11573 [Sarocladium implicatum]